MRGILIVFMLTIFAAVPAFAVPETVAVRVTDVTPTSFSMIWMTDVAADPTVEVYADAGMGTLLDNLKIKAMPDASQDVVTAARAKGIMKVRIAGLTPAHRYYARTVTRDPADPLSVGYSPLMEVNTANQVAPYVTLQDGILTGLNNDLAAMKVYVRPNDLQSQPRLGDLFVVETSASSSPLTAFVGVGTAAPEGVIDLNNLFGQDLASLLVAGGEVMNIRFYRGGTLATLAHYRRAPLNSGVVTVAEPVQGFFADINLDGKVDEADFDQFRKQYRTEPNDGTYNPDYKFVQSPSGKIDVQDFARFAQEYGRSDIQ